MKKYSLFFVMALMFMALFQVLTKRKTAMVGPAFLMANLLMAGKPVKQPGTFSVEDGAIKVSRSAPRLYYDGPVKIMILKILNLSRL